MLKCSFDVSKGAISYISRMKIMIFRYRPLQNRGGGNYLDKFFFRQGGGYY